MRPPIPAAGAWTPPPSPDLGLAAPQAVYAPSVSRLGHKLVSRTQTKGPSWTSAEWHLPPLNEVNSVRPSYDNPQLGRK